MRSTTPVSAEGAGDAGTCGWMSSERWWRIAPEINGACSAALILGGNRAILSAMIRPGMRASRLPRPRRRPSRGRGGRRGGRAGHPPVERRLRARVRRVRRGPVRGMLADDFVGVLADGRVIDKAEFLAQAAQPPDARDLRLQRRGHPRVRGHGAGRRRRRLPQGGRIGRADPLHERLPAARGPLGDRVGPVDAGHGAIN